MSGSLVEIHLARRLFPCGRGNRRVGSEAESPEAGWLAGCALAGSGVEAVLEDCSSITRR